MASISPTCSPTSLQLRLAFNPTKPPLSHHVRLRNINHPRLPPLLCSVHNAKAGSEWVGSDSKGDGLSGWSDSATGSLDNDSQKKKKKESFGGVCMVLEILIHFIYFLFCFLVINLCFFYWNFVNVQ